MKRRVTKVSLVIMCLMMISIFVFATPVHAAKKVKLKPGKYTGVSFYGDYYGDPCYLKVTKKGKKYYATLDIFRLYHIDKLVITQKKNNIIKLVRKKAPKITFKGYLTKKDFVLFVEKSSWKYLKKSDNFTFSYKRK